MSLRFGVALLACCIFPALAGADEVEQALKQQCEGKILVLRHSLQGNSQEYDSDGKVLKGGAEGPWTLYGRIKVDQVGLSAGEFLIKGHRVDYKSAKAQLVPFPNKIPIQIKIALAQIPKNLSEADGVLHRVFAFTKKDVVDSVPDLWKPYLDENMEPRPPKKTESPESVSPKQPELLTRDTTRPERSEPKTARIGPGVKAPRAVFTPDPVFPERASRENYQGVIVVNVIVDRTGRVQNIHVVLPLGMGLEEAAEASLKTWRFKPAEREGEPVDVEMNIEIAFQK